jgi:hypothetical protein
VVSLLDVNVLIALFDPTHVHHDATHTWFGENAAHGWATCALTENAVVRILSNPSYPGRRTTLRDAASHLRQFCESARHTFWASSVSLLDTTRFRLNHVQGHQQITDVYLLCLAVHEGGRLATLDGAIALRSVAGAAASNLVVVGA